MPTAIPTALLSALFITILTTIVATVLTALPTAIPTALLSAFFITILTTIVAKATQLSSTEAGAIYVFDDAAQEFRLRATYGMTAEMIAVITEHHADFSEAVRAATQQRKPDQVTDLQPSSRANELVIRLGYRAVALKGGIVDWLAATTGCDRCSA